MDTQQARVAIESLCPEQAQVQADPTSAWPCILSGVDKDGNFHYGQGADWDEAWAEAQSITRYPTEKEIDLAAEENNVG